LLEVKRHGLRVNPSTSIPTAPNSYPKFVQQLGTCIQKCRRARRKRTKTMVAQRQAPSEVNGCCGTATAYLCLFFAATPVHGGRSSTRKRIGGRVRGS